MNYEVKCQTPYGDVVEVKIIKREESNGTIEEEV